ncbi:hypothetical protein SRB5_29140 [Streptomyces sp. RB5]|uniref:DoxX family protein n=1 Tax=Streptomyces smaragdinus TaxID=2585196 RepID=A0A7K0CH20_9ACTN|nr:DoxX family protein [Streptomyces smaragdinus]MQY12775.1 hypothetical protein [Streptomyces smaragdinus]
MRNDSTSGLLAALPERAGAHALALFRIVVGLLFACHGAATLFDVFGGPRYGGVPPTGEFPDWWASVIQLAGGTLVLLGLGTRSAAVLCSGSMAYAYFTKHQPDGLLPLENGGEAAVMFCWSFLLIALLGPGRWALAGIRGAMTGTPATVPRRQEKQPSQ